MKQGSRYPALDIFRGFTVAAMILVNTPGSWQYVYPALLHASWHGLTPTDFIFPFFLFIVGSALYFSSRSQQHVSFSNRIKRIIRRSILLFGIGLLLNLWVTLGDFSQLRYLGVLQRIALCFLVASFIVMLPFRFRVGSIVLLLGAYTLFFIGSADSYSLTGNPVRALDVYVLGEAHMWAGLGVAFEPEGLFSTLPAIVSVLLGYELTQRLVSLNPGRREKYLAMIAVAILLVGLVLTTFIPINKSLWTASFVFITSSAAILVLVLLAKAYEYREKLKLKALLQAAHDFGLNPLFIYVLSWVWVVGYYHIDVGGDNLAAFLFAQLAGVFPPKLASLVFALTHVVLFWQVARFMRSRAWRISI